MLLIEKNVCDSSSATPKLDLAMNLSAEMDFGAVLISDLDCGNLFVKKPGMLLLASLLLPLL